LTRTSLSVSHVLHIPYVCTRMLRAAHGCADILDYAMQAAHDWASHMGMEPCVSLAKESVAWLAMFGTSVSGTPECALATPLALEDGHGRKPWVKQTGTVCIGTRSPCRSRSWHVRVNGKHMFFASAAIKQCAMAHVHTSDYGLLNNRLLLGVCNSTSSSSSMLDTFGQTHNACHCQRFCDLLMTKPYAN